MASRPSSSRAPVSRHLLIRLATGLATCLSSSYHDHHASTATHYLNSETASTDDRVALRARAPLAHAKDYG